jgi:N-acetylglucosaminyldiphosphoundecaprenol N-acetyl-beta-D-mannosaminyltransferase
MYLSSLKEKIYNKSLQELPDDKILIMCLNAHSFNVIQKDKLFQSSLLKSHIILPDGIAIVIALRLLIGTKLRKISGHELFYYELEQLNQINGRCFFLGSSELTNSLIKINLAKEYPNVVSDSYSPPFNKEFSEEDSQSMISAVNNFGPDVLFIGMTQPKQEKWAALHFNNLNTKHICCIGAVFDFYAGTINRAPQWMINVGFEWLYRLIKEPKRLWRRYILGNPKFVALILMEKLKIAGLKQKNIYLL